MKGYLYLSVPLSLSRPLSLCLSVSPRRPLTCFTVWAVTSVCSCHACLGKCVTCDPCRPKVIHIQCRPPLLTVSQDKECVCVCVCPLSLASLISCIESWPCMHHFEKFRDKIFFLGLEFNQRLLRWIKKFTLLVSLCLFLVLYDDLLLPVSLGEIWKLWLCQKQCWLVPKFPKFSGIHCLCKCPVQQRAQQPDEHQSTLFWFLQEAQSWLLLARDGKWGIASGADTRRQCRSVLPARAQLLY